MGSAVGAIAHLDGRSFGVWSIGTFIGARACATRAADGDAEEHQGKAEEREHELERAHGLVLAVVEETGEDLRAGVKNVGANNVRVNGTWV